MGAGQALINLLNIGYARCDFTAKLGLKTEIAFDGKGGALTIHFQSLEQPDREAGIASCRIARAQRR